MSVNTSITGKTFIDFVKKSKKKVNVRPSRKDKSIINALVVGEHVFFIPKDQQKAKDKVDYKALGQLVIMDSNTEGQYFLGEDRDVTNMFK